MTDSHHAPASAHAGAREINTGPTRARSRHRSRRAILLTWLRQTHLYLGLWGAVLGLLFGATGILLNHRAVMKIPVEKTVQKTVQVPVPSAGFSAPEDLVAWLQQEFRFAPLAPPIVRLQPQTRVHWNGQDLQQPARWMISLQRPQGGLTAEYYLGDRTLKLERIDATPIGTLTRLHMAVGASAWWILLADTIAGAMILLSLTGLLLWTQLHTVRTTAVLLSAGALFCAVWFTWAL